MHTLVSRLGSILYRFMAILSIAHFAHAESNPILFVTQVPLPRDFATINAVFGNHRGAIDAAPRGGDLWIRYPNGALKNLTAAAGYGKSGLQTGDGIAVRDPAVHWNGTKALFSMVIGAPNLYETGSYFFQLYEVSGLGPLDTPVITKVPHQPQGANNVMPVYGSDDQIIFISDKALKNLDHTYPQRDEYESTATNTGLWKLNPQNGELSHLDHSPSGDFDPLIDSFGRIIFTRWDHLQRDQQNVGVSFGAFNYAHEQDSIVTSSTAEFFPEPRSTVDPDFVSTTNTHTLNHFLPWMISQTGTGLETLNHIGRHELVGYIPQSFNNDPGLEEYYGQYSRLNSTEIDNLLHIHEDPTRPGLFIGVNPPEFETHAAGQLVSLVGAPSVNPDDMALTYLTHPDTASTTSSPPPTHSGLYRDPLPLTDGNLLAAHTTATTDDDNIGSRAEPRSRYAFRIKRLVKSGSYYLPGTPLTPGIVKTVSYYDPDVLVTYNNVTMWELQPVEVVARARPVVGESPLPAIEAAVIASAGVDLGALRNFLEINDLALVISRDLTRRDGADHQQPRNLKAYSTETRADSGKLYEIAHLQFFQGDLIRGYANGNGPTPGRRVLAQAMASRGANPPGKGPPGSVALAQDGSMAAFVPAGRALTWQTTTASGEPVVRERFWLTFKKGEIRVCTSCHGVNRTDQAGNEEPTNPPQALTTLLNYWRGLDHAVPLPTPGATPPRTRPTLSVRSLHGRRLGWLSVRRPFVLDLRGSPPGIAYTIGLRYNPPGCQISLGDFITDSSGAKRIRLRLSPYTAQGHLRFIAASDIRTVARSNRVAIKRGRHQERASGCPSIQVLGTR